MLGILCIPSAYRFQHIEMGTEEFQWFRYRGHGGSSCADLLSQML